MTPPNDRRGVPAPVPGPVAPGSPLYRLLELAAGGVAAGPRGHSSPAGSARRPGVVIVRAATWRCDETTHDGRQADGDPVPGGRRRARGGDRVVGGLRRHAGRAGGRWAGVRRRPPPAAIVGT